MAIDTIGQLGLDIAEQEARGYESDIAGRRELARGIQGGVEAGLSGAQNALQYELETARKREAEAFLKNGAQEVVNYASSMGLDPTLYKKLVANVKDPKEFIPLFKTAKQAGEKKAEDANVLNFVTQLEALSGVSDDNKFNAMINKFNSKIVGTESEQKRMRDALKSAKDTRDATVKKSAGRSISPGELADKYGQKVPSKESDEKAIRELQKAMVFGSRGGQRVLGTAINKQVAIQDALDTISGIEEGEFEATQQIGQEIASIIAQVLSTGGTSTLEDRRAMFPNSWKGTITNQIQEIKGKPLSAIPKPLIDQLKHMLEREKNFWDSRISDVNKSLSGMLSPIFNRTAMVNGKLTRIRKEDQKQFANWLINQDRAYKSVSERIGKDRSDILDLIASDEDKQRWIEEAQNSDLKLENRNALADFFSNIKSGGSTSSFNEGRAKDTTKKETITLPNGEKAKVGGFFYTNRGKPNEKKYRVLGQGKYEEVK